MSDIKKNILSTIIYYDILDYPMTAFEVWKYLGTEKKDDLDEGKISLGEVVRELDSNEELKKKIEGYRGFYFLRGRSSLVEKRLKKNKLSEQKFKIIKRVVFWLSFLPYVRMVAVTGTVAMKNAALKSDLDLLVVTRRGRIFFGRTLVTGLVQFMGKRRYGDKIADRICLNCFLTDESLESRLQDLFSSSEYFFAVPLFGQKTFAKFLAENVWLKKFKTNFQPDETANLKYISERWIARATRNIMEKLFDLSVFDQLENRLEKWQIERIARDPRTKEDGSIIMADAKALIFFHRAHGLTMAELFQKRLKEGVLD